MILIISDPLDVHVRLVRQRLAELGADVARFDVGEFPLEAKITAEVSGSSPTRVVIRRELGDVDLSRVRTVWFRRLSPVRADPRLSPEERAFATEETEAFLLSLAAALSDRFCVNPIAHALATDRGRGKVSQLEAARRAGLAVPRTLVTNDPDEARAFVRSCDAGAVYKPFRAPTRTEEREGELKVATVYTTKLDDAALARLDGVRAAPCIFQEHVAKRLDLRVTVMGERVFATEIHSQGDPRSAVDFRMHYDLERTPYSPHELPAEVKDRLLAVNRALGLVFGAFDLVLTPDGRYVFLEVNQQGQFLWLEAKTGQPLLENFCQMLLQATPAFRCDAPPHPPGLPDLRPL